MKLLTLFAVLTQLLCKGTAERNREHNLHKVLEWPEVQDLSMRSQQTISFTKP